MNLWDYYEWEAKKYGHGMNYASTLLVNDFSSSGNRLPYFYRWSVLLTFAAYKQQRKFMWRKDHYEWWQMCVCNICLALSTNLLAH